MNMNTNATPYTSSTASSTTGSSNMVTGLFPDRASAGSRCLSARHDRRDTAGGGDSQPPGSTAQRHGHRGAHRAIARTACQ